MTSIIEGEELARLWNERYGQYIHATDGATEKPQPELGESIVSTYLKAQTYVDLEAGLKVIDNLILHILHGRGDDAKVRLTTKEGALAVLDEVDQVTQTLREVIAHDTGESVKIKILHLLTGRNYRC